MFYCDPCAAKNKWPKTLFKSSGRCEVCRQGATCNELPSDQLSMSKVEQ